MQRKALTKILGDPEHCNLVAWCLTWHGDLGLLLLGKTLVPVSEGLQLKLTGVTSSLQVQQQQDIVPGKWRTINGPCRIR